MGCERETAWASLTTPLATPTWDVIAVEPGIYRRDLGGCRIEDLVLVTQDGAEVLTRFPYELR